MAKDKEEKHESASGAEEPKKSGGLGTGAIIGIIGGFVVLLAVLVAVFFLFIMPKLSGDAKGKGKDSTHTEKDHGGDSGHDGASTEDDELTYKSVNIRVGKIITLKEFILNANGSLKNFVVADVGIEIPKTKHEMEEEDKKLEQILEKGKAEGGDGHGGGGGGEGTKIDDMLGEGVELVVRDKILGILAARSKEDLQQVAVRDSLRKQIQVEIQPYFRKIKVRNVYFSRFIIQ
jgi:flagellar basal body-associated protein FliL